MQRASDPGKWNVIPRSGAISRARRRVHEELGGAPMRHLFLAGTVCIVIAGCAASTVSDDDPTSGAKGLPAPMDPNLGGDKKPMCAGGGAETCDGKDNDCNGVIDDVDVGHD